MRGVYLCLLLILLTCARCAGAATRHVPGDYASIQAAIDSAVNGDTVLVAPGDYDGDINFAGKGIHLKSSAGPSQTTLRRSQGGQVVFLYTDDHDASIEGFTIAATTAGTGWAIKVYLSHAHIVGNVFTGDWAFGDYAAIAIELLEAASPVIEGNTFGFNRCALVPGSPAGSVIRANAGASAQVINNVFSRTQCRAIAAEITSTSTFTIINNTFSDNAVAIALTYTSFTDASDVVIRNNIIAHSATALTAESTAGTTLSVQPSIDHNLFFDNFAIVTGLSDPTAGNANVIADPKFVLMPDILRLDIGSPAIDAGSADAAPALDIAGNARNPAAMDIGAYEWVAGPGIPVFGESTPTISEAHGNYQISILRREGASGPLNLLVEAAPGSAAQGADFLPLSTPLTFADGDNATQTLSLGIIDDNVREESETLWLRIRDGASAQILAETEVTLTDNDISDLALAVTRQPQGPTTTSALSYLFSVSNTDSTQSGVSVQAVVLTVTLSRPAGGVSAQIEGGSCDVGDQIVCSLGLLAANSTRNVTLNFAQPGYGPLVMSASLSGTGSDSAPANSSIGDLTQVQLSFDAAQYFPLDVGAQWVYSTDFGNTSITVSRLAGTFAINGHQAVALQFAEPGSQPGVPYLATNFYTLDGNGLRLVRQQDDELRLTYNPPLPLLPANGLTGTTLQGSGTLEIASASGNSFAVLGTVPYTSAAQVIVQEQVETPSGTYDALKVEVAQAASGTLPVVGAIDVSATDSYWLARDAGAVLLDLDQPDGPPRALTLTSLTLDGDLDGINRPQDNCPELANANQDDFDHDGLGDACDADDDNDGVPDTSDAFPANAAESTDTDNDGVGNNADEDDDGDGLPDSIETANGLNPLNGDDGAGDADGDGLSNVAEYLAGTAINDSDSDHDGVSDSVEIARGRNPLLNEGAVINIILQSLL